MSTIRIALALSMLLLTVGLTEARNPWTRAKGDGYFQLSGYGIGPYERLFRSDGTDFGTSREITETTIEAYGEYGVTDKWTVLGVIPYRSLDSGNLAANPTIFPATTTSGTFGAVGNIIVGARRKVIDSKFLLATQIDLGLPTRSFDEPTGLSTGADAFTVAPSAAIGKGFRRAYVYGYAGLGLRTNDFSSYWRAGGEGGYRLFGRLWLIGMLDAVGSFKNGDILLPRTNLETGLFVNDQEFVAYGAKVIVEITRRVGIHFVWNSAISGNNVPRSPLFGGGVYYKLTRGGN